MVRFEPDDTPVAQEIRREVIARRDCGRVYIEFRRIASTDSAEAVAAAFVASLGLRAPSAWKRLDSRRARDAASRVLCTDLAYSGSIMTVDVATALAIRFVDHCGEGAEFLTNGEIALSTSGSWLPTTSATFDTGVIGIGHDRLGFLWVEDAD
jgi:hypothetical protein